MNVKGVDPPTYDDADSYDNIYVFYVTGKEMKRPAENLDLELTYTATDWDILYPVKRGGLKGLITSSRYVLKSDYKNGGLK